MKIKRRAKSKSAPAHLRAAAQESWSQVQAALAVQDLAAAERALRETLKRQAEHWPARQTLMRLLAETGRADEARVVAEESLALRPSDAALAHEIGMLLVTQGAFASAFTAFEVVARQLPHNADAQNNLGGCLREMERNDDAARYFAKALKLDPAHPHARFNMAQSLMEAGRRSEAVAALLELLKLNPEHADALRLLALWDRSAVAPEHRSALERLAARPEGVDDAAMRAGFGLAALLEAEGDYGAAFAALSRANARMRASYTYDVADDVAQHAALMAATPSLDGDPQSGVDDATPIFILGMPRSGTSLVEQILASHSHVAGGGERNDLRRVVLGGWDARGWRFPDGMQTLSNADVTRMAQEYLQRLREVASPQQARRITDKMPANYLFIGLIRRMLPNARIIHCVRDPRDVALSIFKTWFSGELPYAYDLAELGRYFAAYERLMAHWKALAPEAIYRVRYETLVAQPEAEIRQLLDFCGLPFEQACVDFHRSKRVVRTASLAQVRQPIYGGAVARWKRYGDEALRPFTEALGASDSLLDV
ncbi:tetratricopeptide repeat-containing sulfotransferase family protein [Magnetofaba australis]|uniref:Putative sulfotransferase n=1 Tax=Magnetofaba australis IT-1 TaxID=1434232 RepID=A0A1Y2K0W9_9PROT|nr:sulfotransferase family protein [Magnetofaba australis]OSM01622.1 putative sulfotransferase [Magnetofaba australis IT-1]